MSLKVINWEKYSRIDNKDIVKLKIYNNNLTEIVKTEKANKFINIKKINDNEYIDLRTGEVLECNHIENRSQNISSVKLTMKKIRDLINANISPENKNHWLFVTLTYKKNMTDREKLYNDFKNFKKRFKEVYPDFIKYINVAEPQGRGAWHLHCFFGFSGNAPYISNLDKLWKQGFVNIRQIGDIDNLGAYLSAYLCDIEETEENLKECKKNGLQGYTLSSREVEENGKKVKKSFIKGRPFVYVSTKNEYY